MKVKCGLGAGCRLSNSCNGLVCVVVFWDSVVLWNPSIQDYRRIPTRTSRVLSDANHNDIFGLGYDSITDDYKIVRFPGIHCNRTSRSDALAGNGEERVGNRILAGIQRVSWSAYE
ncbi:hypothetical protein Dsin_029671 [Dipteronia sinensis]|uniref:F-box associated beta-propeller type 1 domain-containing protein n=1 Tax=Dipteronia sinensis TaxID=43782 RepID=A0AAD9ZSZ4_9ROSI|nr:hypothetical protein Dsin_029671 [Dipteronia sinensis]